MLLEVRKIITLGEVVSGRSHGGAGFRRAGVFLIMGAGYTGVF